MRENEKRWELLKGSRQNFINDRFFFYYSVAWGLYSVLTIQNYKNICIGHYYMKGNSGKTRNVQKEVKQGQKGGDQFHRLRKFAALRNFVTLAKFHRGCKISQPLRNCKGALLFSAAFLFFFLPLSDL